MVIIGKFIVIKYIYFFNHYYYYFFFSSLRLPIGYWNIIEDPYEIFSPKNYSYSLSKIHWLFAQAELLNITILVDLHGAPGSQNYIDHSGCNDPSIPSFLTPENQNLTFSTLEIIAKEFSSYKKTFLGIELLNEPSLLLTNDFFYDLISFYHKSYQIIRKINLNCLIVINDIYDQNYEKYFPILQTNSNLSSSSSSSSTFDPFYYFQEPYYYNFVFDLHLYNWQEPYTYISSEEHIINAKNYEYFIKKLQKNYPIMIGEWSMSTGIYLQSGQPFVKACIDSFYNSGSYGWYLWNWKVDHDKSSESSSQQPEINTDPSTQKIKITRPTYFEWDAQYQSQLKGGLNPIPK